MPTVNVTVDGKTHALPVPTGVEVTPDLVDQLGAAIRAQQQTGGGGLIQGPAAALGAATAPTPPPTPAQGAPISQSPLLSAVNQRVVQPALDVVRPESTMGERVLGAVAAGSTVFAPGATAAGIGAQTALQSFGMDSSAASLMSAIAELGVAGVGPAVRARFMARGGPTLTGIGGTPITKGGRQIVREVESLGAGGLTRAEQLGRTAKLSLGDALRRDRERLGQVFDQVEEVARTRKLKAQPGTYPYEALRESVNGMIREQIQMPSHLQGDFNVLARSLAANQRLPASQLRIFAKQLAGIAKPGRESGLDPRLTGFAGQLRGILDDVFESALPAAEAKKFRAVRDAWRAGVAEPSQILSQVLDPTTAPLVAFNSLFQTTRPDKLRTAAALVKDSPGTLVKLRLGFLEQLVKTTGGFESKAQHKKAAEVLGHFRPVLLKGGLFTGKELDNMQMLFRRGQVPSLGGAFRKAFTGSPLVTVGALGALGAIGNDPEMTRRITGFDPTTYMIVGLAAGALPSMQRLLVVKDGGRAAERFGAIVAGQIAQAGRALKDDFAAVSDADSDDRGSVVR